MGAEQSWKPTSRAQAEGHAGSFYVSIVFSEEPVPSPPPLLTQEGLPHSTQAFVKCPSHCRLSQSLLTGYSGAEDGRWPFCQARGSQAMKLSLQTSLCLEN